MRRSSRSSGTDPASYITEYTVIYEDNKLIFSAPFLRLQVQRKAADDEKKQQKARAQAQKTTKEAFKFVKEIGDLSRYYSITCTRVPCL